MTTAVQWLSDRGYTLFKQHEAWALITFEPKEEYVVSGAWGVKDAEAFVVLTGIESQYVPYSPSRPKPGKADYTLACLMLETQLQSLIATGKSVTVAVDGFSMPRWMELRAKKLGVTVRLGDMTTWE